MGPWIWSFGTPNDLRRLYPQLVRLGMISFSSPDVLRFMGKRVPAGWNYRGGPMKCPLARISRSGPMAFASSIATGPNSIKLYDKAYDELGAVLRPEITISDPRLFRVFRRANDDEKAPLKIPQDAQRCC